MSFQLRSIILISLLFEAACSMNDRISEVSKKTLEFEMSSTDKNKIGYRKDTITGEIHSISSMVKIGQKLFVLDPVHNNIKCIDLDSGKIEETSPDVTSTGSPLTDIAFSNRLLYISSFDDSVVIFEPQMKKKAAVKIDNPFGEKRFFFQGGQLRLSTYASESWQNQANEFHIRVSTLGTNNTVTVDTIKGGQGYEEYRQLLDGFGIEQNDSTDCYVANKQSLCVKRLIRPDYVCRNVIYTDGILVHFYLTTNRFVVQIFQ